MTKINNKPIPDTAKGIGGAPDLSTIILASKEFRKTQASIPSNPSASNLRATSSLLKPVISAPT